MALAPGTHIGSYDIVGLLGAGGMGEVYRAHDTQLNREIALKVLPETVAADPERLARFRREAQALASLNHPNIAQIYGLEGSTGSLALAMELVEGPTLAEKLEQGSGLSLEEALPIARQIAEALEAAHEQGIVHRDLKPANVKVRGDGTVKVLDFGLAKMLDPAGPERSHQKPDILTASPTMMSPAMTGVGVILGTAAYMSPEQARGAVVDRRADIWALGCVLYEMLTGVRPFQGETVTEVIAAVLERDVDWTRLPAATPVNVRRMLQRCLRKDPRRRFHHSADVRLELDDNPSDIVSASPSPPRRTIPWLVAAASGVLTIGALAFAYSSSTRKPPVRVTRLTATPSGEFGLKMNGVDREFAISPDGTRLVYVGTGRLLVRALDQMEPTPLASGSDLRAVFVSADSQWAGFVDNLTTLKKVPLSGGPTSAVTEMDGSSRGATWGPDNSIIFATSSRTTGLQQVSANGGSVTVLTRPTPGEDGDHQFPEMLPGGRAVLFTIVAPTQGVEASQIAVLDLASLEIKVLVRGGTDGHYLSSGHLLYAAGGKLMATRFDLAKLTTIGTPVTLLPKLYTTAWGSAAFDASADGTLAFVDQPGPLGDQPSTIVWVDRQGRESSLNLPPHPYVEPRISPDGTRMAVGITDRDQDIWTFEFARQILTRLTFEPVFDRQPHWSSDGTRVFYSSSRNGQLNIFVRSLSGDASQQITKNANQQILTSVTPDGKSVVFSETVPGKRRDVRIAFLDGTREPETLVSTPFEDRNGVVAPNGRWLAYESDATGQFEIYVKPLADVNAGPVQISASGGSWPLWARNGKELFYVHPDGTLASVSVDIGGASWNSGETTNVPVPRYLQGRLEAGTRQYDVSPDGRFLMLKPVESPQAPRITILQDAFQELSRLAPEN